MCSCMPPITFKSLPKKPVYIRKVPIRSGAAVCYKDSVNIGFEGQRFKMVSSKVNMDLHAINLTMQDPNLYTAMDMEGSGFTIFYYEYRGRLFMQVTPVPKGFTDRPDEPECIYVVTTDNVCN